MELYQSSNVKLSELREGAVEEQFQQALAKVLANIEDVNTDPRAKRSLTIKIEFTPSPDRSGLTVDATVGTKLQAAVPIRTFMILKHDEKNRPIGHEPIQEQIPYDQQN